MELPGRVENEAIEVEYTKEEYASTAKNPSIGPSKERPVSLIIFPTIITNGDIILSPHANSQPTTPIAFTFEPQQVSCLLFGCLSCVCKSPLYSYQLEITHSINQLPLLPLLSLLHNNDLYACMAYRYLQIIANTSHTELLIIIYYLKCSKCTSKGVSL